MRRQRGIADVAEMLQRDVREHADSDGVLHVDAAADAAGHIDVSDTAGPCPWNLSIVIVAEKIAPLARMKLSMSTSLMSTSRTRPVSSVKAIT